MIEKGPFRPLYQQVPIDCFERDSLLLQIHDADQAIRNYGGEGNMVEIDERNFSILASLIDQCGWPKFNRRFYDLNTNREQDIRLGLFLVLQHAGPVRMSRYYFDLKKTAENDYLHPSDFALYQDRLLMYYDLPQVYGSQITHSESIELYRVWNAENINERRREVYMPPIEEYLYNFGLNFEEEKQRMQSNKK